MPRQMTINEKQFQVMDATEAGIVAGMVLDEAAARHLFQTRTQNVSNNLRSRVKAWENEGRSEEEIQNLVAEYDRNYTFSMPGTSAGRQPIDPLDREARSLAKDWIKNKLAESGRKIKDVDPERLEAKVQEVAATEQIQKLAKKRIAEKKKAGAEALELDL